MAETAQPETAAESEAASIADAANAFKSFNPDADTVVEPLRDDRGRFAREDIEAEEPEAELAEGDEAESHDEDDADEAADEAQPEAVELPTSWPAEHGEMWQSLPPEAQAFIRQRDGEQAAAVNAKFQEAANVRKANEAIIIEADTNRKHFAEMADLVLQALPIPQMPSPSMLNPQSGDYNPDAYHLQKRQHEDAISQFHAVQQHRQAAIAQQEQQNEATRQQRIAEINEKAYPALVKDVPELGDPAKHEQAFLDIARYALSQGVPEETPLDAFNATELHLLWKAQQYDKMVAAKGRVQPKAAAAPPPVRPGVTTSRSANEASTRKKAFERLDREGSVEAAAALFKLQAKR